MKWMRFTKQEKMCLVHIRRRIELVSKLSGPAPISITMDLSDVTKESLSCFEGVISLLHGVEVKAHVGWFGCPERRGLWQEMRFRIFPAIEKEGNYLTLYRDASMTWRDILKFYPEISLNGE